MGLHNPLPSSMASECKKCGKILTSFIDPKQSFGPDKVIPPSVLAGAKGLAILTVLKAGFLGSGRFGSGLVVARLPDGSWSAPSAIMTAGAGIGGQIGFEITDFVFILNDASAVKTFSQAGSLTLGGNVSIAAGPVGRNAEAAGAASMHSVAGIFAYSKTKGLFAGVSLEGSVIVERKDANEKMYGHRLTAGQLLSGNIPPPPAAQPLLGILNSRAFSGMRSSSVGGYDEHLAYTDSGGNTFDDPYSNNRRSSGYGETRARGDDPATFGVRPSRASTWQSDTGFGRAGAGVSSFGRNSRHSTFNEDSEYVYRDNPDPPMYSPEDGSGKRGSAPGRPSAPKPVFKSKTESLAKNEAVALFNFDADQPGDLAFKKGDIITVLKKTDSDNDWWTGMVGTRHGIFPSNYVKTKE